MPARCPHPLRRLSRRARPSAEPTGTYGYNLPEKHVLLRTDDVVGKSCSTPWILAGLAILTGSKSTNAALSRPDHRRVTLVPWVLEKRRNVLFSARAGSTGGAPVARLADKVCQRYPKGIGKGYRKPFAREARAHTRIQTSPDWHCARPGSAPCYNSATSSTARVFKLRPRTATRV